MCEQMSIMELICKIEEVANTRYKVRAIRENGEQSRVVGGWGTDIFYLSQDTFANSKDIEERLIPSVIAQNKYSLDGPIVRLEAYYEKEINVASLDLNVQKETVSTTHDSDWKQLA